MNAAAFNGVGSRLGSGVGPVRPAPQEQEDTR